jgi:UDP-N-acetylmuramate dehydrogenase
MVSSHPFSGMKSPIFEQVPLNNRTTLRMGGATRWLAQPTNKDELSQLWSELPEEVPSFLIGGGSNILVEDAGFSGVAVDIRRNFNRIEPEKVESDDGGILLNAEAGVSSSTLAHYARRHGLTGAEFLGGIPGTIGGAMRMNAGANGGDIASILLEARILDREGNIQIWPVKQLGLAYRHSGLPAGSLFISGRFKLQRGEPEDIREKMRQFNQQRKNSQPLNFASAGSTFKNPPKGPAAWKLIHEAGARGISVGDAQVSEKHSNFLINRGRAKSANMLALIDKVRDRVMQKTGVSLELEVAILGLNGFRSC